jgi:hypothetical protein
MKNKENKSNNINRLYIGKLRKNYGLFIVFLLCHFFFNKISNNLIPNSLMHLKKAT